MRFDHLMAGNAQDWFRFGAGTAVRPASLFGVALLTVLALLVLPATGRAADPLLSGYAGPGGGEQVVLGGAMVNPPGGGSGGSGTLRATSTPASAGTAAPAAGSSASGTPAATSSSAAGSHKASGTHAKATSGARAPAAAPAAVATGAPPVVAYPTSGSTSAGGLAVPVGALLAALLGLAALILVGFGLRRLGRPGLDRAGPPQVSGR
jgi:hypothetical protein